MCHPRVSSVCRLYSKILLSAETSDKKTGSASYKMLSVLAPENGKFERKSHLLQNT